MVNDLVFSMNIRIKWFLEKSSIQLIDRDIYLKYIIMRIHSSILFR